MPITPHFTLSQTESTVTVDIRVPHVRVSVQSVEVVLDGSVLHFSSPPYLLVLNFPAPLQEATNEECATYDPSRNGGTIRLRLKKQQEEIWKDLDMMGTLMRPKQPPSRPANMTIVSSTTNEVEDSVECEKDRSTSLQPESSGLLPDLKNALRPHYGFLNMHVGVFTDLAREGLAAEMLELPFPDETLPSDRRTMRLEAEQSKFDADRYLGDLNIDQDYIYQVAMAMVPHWTREHQERLRSNSSAAGLVDDVTEQMAQLSTTSNGCTSEVAMSSNSYFTEDETAQLASIPYPLLPETISARQEEALLLGLLDVLFAYVYDHTMTDGEPTVESSWTVCILSCTLSWLEDYSGENVHSVVSSSMRRALIYPYLRNYNLSIMCWRHVACILDSGRRCVIRCLLQVRSILDKSECHYLGNRLYIDPYLAWMQRNVTDSSLFKVHAELLDVLDNSMGKDRLGLNLVELERMMEEEEETFSEDGSGDSASESTSSNDDSSSNEDDDSETDDDSSGGENGADMRPVSETKQTTLSNSETNKTSQEQTTTTNSPRIVTKVHRHSTELLRSELEGCSGAEAVDIICNPQSISTETNQTKNSRDAKVTQDKRPLIEEL